MKFILEIDIGNDAMRTRQDIATKLREVAKDIQNFEFDSMRISDLNGNKVGQWRFEKEESDTKQPYR